MAGEVNIWQNFQKFPKTYMSANVKTGIIMASKMLTGKNMYGVMAWQNFIKTINLSLP